ncbi:MAG3720 family protein [Mycoplasma corogypsi]|uniref:MAG3720 family protein n=1 Tax=Mycoplasma corogypsi TaxID=2106 RepID=UPI003873B56D
MEQYIANLAIENTSANFVLIRKTSNSLLNGGIDIQFDLTNEQETLVACSKIKQKLSEIKSDQLSTNVIINDAIIKDLKFDNKSVFLQQDEYESKSMRYEDIQDNLISKINYLNSELETNSYVISYPTITYITHNNVNRSYNKLPSVPRPFNTIKQVYARFSFPKDQTFISTVETIMKKINIKEFIYKLKSQILASMAKDVEDKWSFLIDVESDNIIFAITYNNKIIRYNYNDAVGLNYFVEKMSESMHKNASEVHNMLASLVRLKQSENFDKIIKQNEYLHLLNSSNNQFTDYISQEAKKIISFQCQDLGIDRLRIKQIKLQVPSWMAFSNEDFNDQNHHDFSVQNIAHLNKLKAKNNLLYISNCNRLIEQLVLTNSKVEQKASQSQTHTSEYEIIKQDNKLSFLGKILNLFKFKTKLA